MDELKQTPEQEFPDATQAAGESGCCGGCAGACPCARPEEAEAQPAAELPSGGDGPARPETVSVVDIHFRSGGKVYFFDPGELCLRPGDHVIIDTARGAEYGICASGCHPVPFSDIVAPLRKVLRIATEQDEKIASDNREKEKRAYEVCLQKIREHKLDMQLVSAECAFDGSKILFFFTADGRVDFRELVKNLASIFRTRIELRQIGVRDKAKMVGGLGVCGRPFCCSQFLDDFQPVSIKMAKTQNLSLNPTKISGTCGRLMCCLKYEQEAYEDLLKAAPKQDSFVDTPEGRGTVCDVNLLRQTVKVRMEDHPETIHAFRTSEIAILRNGKAKKTDPPIPRELAPISGQPRAARRPEPAAPAEDTMPLVFRKLDEYASEPAAGRPAAEPASAAAEEGGSQSRRRSRRRRRPSGAKTGDASAPPSQAPQQERPRQEGKPRQQERKPRPQNPEHPAAPADGAEARPRSNRRRRNRHPRNPGTPPAAPSGTE